MKPSSRPLTELGLKRGPNLNTETPLLPSRPLTPHPQLHSHLHLHPPLFHLITTFIYPSVFVLQPFVHLCRAFLPSHRHGHGGLPRPQQPLAQNRTPIPDWYPVTSPLTALQIRTELEFLCDTGVISTQQLSSILSQLPAQTPLRAPLAPIHASATSTPVEHIPDLSLKDSYPQNPSPAPLPPPAYAQSPPVLAIASALYAYQPTDTGDLALQPNDNIQVLEHMNNDCKIQYTRNTADANDCRVARSQ